MTKKRRLLRQTRILAFLITFVCVCTLTLIGTDANLSKKKVVKSEERVIELAKSPVRILLKGNETYRISLDGKRFSRELPQRQTIKLRHQAFDPLVNPPRMPEVTKTQAPVDVKLYIVQCVTQAIEVYQKDITAAGGEICGTMPYHALIVAMSEETSRNVRNMPFVRWVGIYHPSYKLEPGLTKDVNRTMAATSIRYSIWLTKKNKKNEVAKFIESIGGEVVLKAKSRRMEAMLDQNQLEQVVALPQVLAVDRWTPIEDDMNNVREISGGNYLETVQGYTGQGVRAEVCDGGLRTTHVDFQANPPIIHCGNSSSTSHGTPVTGIVFGDGTGNGNARGMIPDAEQPIFAAYGCFSDRYDHTQELVNPSGSYRAVFQTNSWGNTRTFYYTTISAEMDEIIFDLDILICQSQSNAGNQDSRPQAWAKNIVSVGGLRHYDTLSRSDDCWCTSASIGPADDGRIKPDIWHFYDYTLAPYYTSDTSYTEFGGTSGATPITAGHMGLIFQMWADGVLAGGPGLGRDVFNSRPHCTTAKALLIHSAYQYAFTGTSHDKTRMHQGWGMADVQNLYDMAQSHNWNFPVLIDESAVITPLETHTYNVNVTGTEPLKATLVYADPPGVPGAGVHRINDLSLKVTSPGATVYWGNNGLDIGVWSSSGGSSNTIDTVENVFIQNPTSGTWTIQVLADEVVEDGHVETGAIDADYALIVSGGTSATGNQPPVADFTYTTDYLTVTFTDQSDDPDGSVVSWNWDFGDTNTSTAQNPVHTYATGGTYAVTLTVTDNEGATDPVTKDVTVTGVPVPPVADFTASSTSISVGDSINFTDQSQNTPTSWSWTFEGGSPGSSTAQNPTGITYNTAGTFNVTLVATNAAGSDTETKVDYIDVSAVPYCTSSAGNQGYEYIAGVQVADLNNSSGASPYSDFTNLVANLTQDASANVSLTPGFTGSSYTEYWKIWIDYNGDQDFEDSGEEVFAGSGSSVVSGSFTVPATAPIGDTRMRVSMSYSTYPPYCGTFTYGEVEDYTVNISSAGPQYTLTTNTVGNGSITLNPSGGTYPEGTVVTVTAVPDSGWQFDNWSGDLSGSTNPTTITMDSNKSVTAHFSEVPVQQYTLTVNTVGQGSVALNPPGGVYNEGTVVTLTATADSGWKFDNWSGDLTGSTNPDTITMDSNKTVTAHFSEIGNCTEIVGHNTVFGTSTTTANRRAMPFTMPENGEICSVTMYHTGGSGSMILGVYDGEGLPANRLGVTATTAVSGTTGWQTIDLTSPAFVSGGSTVWLAWVYESNPGIYYEVGDPGRAHSSDTWSGGMPDPFGSSTQSSYIYSIYANYTPTAPPQYTLTTNVVGNGTVTLNPPGGVYDAGTVVTLTATPDSGWQFDSWSGDLSGSTNPTTITMNSNKTVTANFSEIGATGTVGNTTVFGSTSTSVYRRAMPFTMPEDGVITSVTMYHTGGSGSMILAVYDGEGTPQARLAVTPTTTVSGSTGWQTINLTSSAAVSAGQTVWLAWVYESNPGIRYEIGDPGRYQSTETWPGMPDPFGSGSQSSYIYSIYATYNK